MLHVVDRRLCRWKNECVHFFNQLEAEGFQPLNTAYYGVVPFLRCCGLEWTTQ